jgi:hypothetical protein
MKLRRQWRHFWWIKDSEIKVRAGQLPFQNAHFLMRQNVAEPIRTCHLIYSGYFKISDNCASIPKTVQPQRHTLK